MKTLILHIGTPKTGTTSIQNFCGLNRERLDELGIHYPVMPYCFKRVNPTRNGHFLVGSITFDGSRERNIEKENEVFAEELEHLGELFQEHDTIMLSEESIWTISATRKKDLWKILKEHSEKYNYQIKVIVYLRRQDQLMLSRYNQMLKTDVVAGVRRFSSYKKSMNTKFKPMLQYRERIEDIAKYVPKENIIVKRFDRKYFYKGDLTTDFFHILGIELDDTFTPLEEIANVGLSVQSGEIKRIINRLRPISYDDNEKLIALLNECDNLLPESKAAMMSTEQVEKYMKPFIKGNEELAAEYIGDNEPLFDYNYKETTAWDYNDKKYHEEIILFFAKAVGGVYKENQQLKKENQQLKQQQEQTIADFKTLNSKIKDINTKLNKEKAYSRETRYLLKHPIKSFVKKIIGIFKKK